MREESAEAQEIGRVRGAGECTCWVLMRGDVARPEGGESDEYEMISDPECPEHGKKSHAIRDDIHLGGPM